MKKVYLPVSKVCTAAFAAKEAGVRDKSLLFDWNGKSYKTMAYILNNGVDTLFDDIERVDTGDEHPFGHHFIWDFKYQIGFLHEKSEDTVENLKKKYKLKYQKTIKAIKEAEWICLIQSCKEEDTIEHHMSLMQPYIKRDMNPNSENFDGDDLECVKEAILKINPNVQIHITDHHEKWSEVVEEIKFLK